MSFMYLELSYVEDAEGILDNGVHAVVKNDGAFNWLGSQNSRCSDTPFAVYQISGFDGLECIDDDSLWAELESRQPRYGTLAGRFLREATTGELLSELAHRIPEERS
jgi:hypothetical protein